jgi:glycerol-3-phosphate responsive antiterminator
LKSGGSSIYSPHNRKEKMNVENMKELIRLVKSNSDNNLILLKALIELKQKVEKLEKEREVVDVV